ncbi:hypothetical protein LL912_06605 [Niabella sp. CC-SYL272]|uniref:hypothetical protein n=1 Tax=Niabella agricola TaxID=2891571 RepID=UPI001F4580DF|nr:hypothetical protein [Niabella agricola]MCF3108441.1 hypothetical protein [Niabella agricola]
MAAYSILINVPKAADIILIQLVRLLKEAVYTRSVKCSSGAIASDQQSIEWNIEGSISFHDICNFINGITRNIHAPYRYSIINQDPALLPRN